MQHYLDNPYLDQRDTYRIINLVREVNPKVMIEFGCQQGRTSRAILKEIPTLEKYIGVDVLHDFPPSLRNQQSEVPLEGMAGYFAKDDPRFKLMLCQGGSSSLAPMDLPLCDAVFIDGDHSAEGVLNDSYLAVQRIRSPGVVIWHDYGNPATEVKEVLDKLMGSGWPIKLIERTWLAYRTF